jgi:peptidoglycan/LPS O-acetylase OafA/YrhL
MKGSPSSHKRQPGLDLLRAIAIVMVVWYHSAGFGFGLPYDVHRFGWVGVDLFFVLSGYLIGGQILGQLQERDSFRFGRFYARRALRILPAYLVVLAVYFLLPTWRERQVISPLWKFLLSVQNILLQPGTAFSHAWSLAVEDQFYLVLPLLLFGLVRRRKMAMAIPGLIFMGGLLLRAGLASWKADASGQSPGKEYYLWIYYPTWSRLDPLVFGVVLAALERHRASWWSRLTGAAPWLWLPALGMIAGGLYFHERAPTVASCVWSFPMIAIGMALLLVCSVSPRLPFHRRPVPGAAFLARVAYSVYLSHKLVVHFVAGLCTRYAVAPSSFTAIVALDVAIVLCGTALYFAVERPFLQLRNRIEA